VALRYDGPVSEPLTISSLLSELEGARLVRGDGAALIHRVQHDSRQLQAGDLFVAVPGFTVDGHEFLSVAAHKGAAAVLVQEDRRALWQRTPDGPAVIVTGDTRRALSRAAAWSYGFPSREMVVIGVTGTDGKTTTAHLLTGIIEAAGGRVGRLGTVDVYLPGESGKVENRMSTPEAPEVQRLLRRFVEAGCDFAIVESTSHGLALQRLADVEYDIAVLTNVTGDHLDFHNTFEAYRDAKAQLFAMLDTSTQKGPPKFAIVNADDPSAQYMLSKTKARALRFGFESREAEVRAENVHLRADGSSFRLITPIGRVEAEISMPALFNVANAMAAAAAAIACGVQLPAIAQGLAESPGVPGRMERIVAGQPFEVIVDYAHTGDAVRKVLEVLREVCRGKLFIVVGAAGERDPGRRFGVGRAAAEGADFAIFTSEDPRTEDPAAIVAEIAGHAANAGRMAGRDFIEVVDRREAIRRALTTAGPGDVVLIAGKGHEQSMLFGRESRPWDDREVTRAELGALGFTDR
jgi:UDP-N-acetylmuramyl-tripeptide synthetase